MARVDGRRTGPWAASRFAILIWTGCSSRCRSEPPSRSSDWPRKSERPRKRAERARSRDEPAWNLAGSGGRAGRRSLAHRGEPCRSDHENASPGRFRARPGLSSGLLRRPAQRGSDGEAGKGSGAIGSRAEEARLEDQQAPAAGNLGPGGYGVEQDLPHGWRNRAPGGGLLDGERAVAGGPADGKEMDL